MNAGIIKNLLVIAICIGFTVAASYFATTRLYFWSVYAVMILFVMYQLRRSLNNQFLVGMFSIISFTEHMAGGMVLGPMKRAGIDYFMITHGLNITQLIFCTLMLLSVYHRRKIMQRCRAWFGWDITLEVTPVDRIHNFINFFLWTITFILTVWTIYVMYGLADLTQLEYIKAQADLKATVFTYLKIYLAAEIMRYISIFLFLPVRDISTPSGGGRTDTSVEHIPTSSPVHARTESSNTYSRTRIDE